jgi:hypothetical protein
MSSDPVVTALSTPGHLTFRENLHLKKHFDSAGGRVVRDSTGHLIFYRSDGRRILAADPAGHALHECEWQADQQGKVRLVRARLRLDWGTWVGLKPSGLVNETTLNLAAKPGWQRLKPDDLRAMAAQALRVSLEDVRWFYRDEDLSISAQGLATIRQRKDAWYVLEDAEFDRARFMSCMGAMHWESIDFLPVVELFKSLLPGTGSAAFELIRGLYDDQNQGRPSPVRLRYRGIPAYPSEAAFRLFQSCFVPQAPPGKDALSVFMDPEKAHQIEWLPSPTPPRRCFDDSTGSCLTIQGDVLQKVTLANDAAGLSYVNPKGRAFLLCDRAAQVIHGQVVLTDRDAAITLTVPLPQGCCEGSEPPQALQASPIDWKSVFVDGLPQIPPHQAYGAVLLYPEDDMPVGELPSQPFVADYLQDIAEQDAQIGSVLARAERVLIENGDAVISTCVLFDRPRDYMVLVRNAAFAQKQAQQLWTTSAQLQRWDWLKRIRFVSVLPPTTDSSSPETFDIIYCWMPFEVTEDRRSFETAVEDLRRRLRAGGHAFVTGPASLDTYWPRAGFRVQWQAAVDQLPTFRMHRTILPQSRLKAGLTLYHVMGI